VTLSSPGTGEEDVSCKFEIPPGTKDDYFFAATFANDHRITIINDCNSTVKLNDNSQSTEFKGANNEHRRMFASYRRRLDKIYTSAISNTDSAIREKVISYSQNWDDLHHNDAL
jgi:hypothetical protein